LVTSHKELIAYQKAYKLVLVVYRVTKAFPAEELYGLTSQMRRCAVSIPSNIAEGYMRGTKEYAHFLRVALGSAAELDTQLSLGKDLRYIGEEAYGKMQGELEEILKLLRTYINKMTSQPKARETEAPYTLPTNN
jgi:four helix bundle protein